MKMGTGYTLEGATKALSDLSRAFMETGVQPSIDKIDRLRDVIQQHKKAEEMAKKKATRKKVSKKKVRKKSIFGDEAASSLSEIRDSSGILLGTAEVIPVETKKELLDKASAISEEDALKAFCAPVTDITTKEEFVEAFGGVTTVAEMGTTEIITAMDTFGLGVLEKAAEEFSKFDPVKDMAMSPIEIPMMPAPAILSPTTDLPAGVMAVVSPAMEGRLAKIETQINGIYRLLHDIVGKL